MPDHNEAMRLAEACKHGWLENVDPDKCSLDDLLALLRQQAERIAELEKLVEDRRIETNRVIAIADSANTKRDQLRAEVEKLRAVVLRMAAGIDHLSEIARQWEPDHSSGADRRGWVLAKDARNDALKLLKEHAARTTHKETE